MKRLVSLLTLALVSSLFAVGCGKEWKATEATKTECGKATTPETCGNQASGDEGTKCGWNPEPAPGKCVPQEAPKKKETK